MALPQYRLLNSAPAAGLFAGLAGEGESEAASGPPGQARVQAVDVVRGVVMVIMALDHIREFWSPLTVRPEDVAQASAALFLTRWSTW